MKVSLIFILLILAKFTILAQSKPDDPSKADGTKIVFRTGTFETNLFDLEYIGQLKGIRKKPFLIFMGCPCDSCELNSSIYIHSPSDGPLKPGKKQKRYNQPGPINDYQTREEVYRARLFWGEVLPGRFGMIWFQKELKKDDWVESVYFAELVNDAIVDGFVKEEMKTTLAQMEKGKAWEIKGEPISSEPVK